MIEHLGMLGLHATYTPFPTQRQIFCLSHAHRENNDRFCSIAACTLPPCPGRQTCKDPSHPRRGSKSLGEGISPKPHDMAWERRLLPTGGPTQPAPSTVTSFILFCLPGRQFHQRRRVVANPNSSQGGFQLTRNRCSTSGTLG